MTQSPITTPEQALEAAAQEVNLAGLRGMKLEHRKLAAARILALRDRIAPAMTDVTTPEEMREAAARIADAHEPQHEANATIANQVARNIAKAIRAIPISQPDVAQAARVLLNNLPGEHDAWESLQNTVDDGCDVGDCMKAFLRALIGELK